MSILDVVKLIEPLGSFHGTTIHGEDRKRKYDIDIPNVYMGEIRNGSPEKVSKINYSISFKNIAKLMYLLEDCEFYWTKDWLPCVFYKEYIIFVLETYE